MSTSTTAWGEWRRWGILPLASALGYATAVLHVYSLGPYIEPLQREFSWSRAEVSAGLSVSALLSALLCIPIGMLVDRYGPRRIALPGIVAMSAAVGLLGTATGSVSNWLFLWALVGVGTFGVQATVWTSAVASRFSASRGLAFAVTLSGASLSATVFPLLSTWLIGLYEWRTAFMAMAAIWAALVIPMVFLFFRGVQDEPGWTRAAAAQAQTGLTLQEGLRSSALYKLLAAASLFTFTAIGLLVHFVPILKDAGAAPLEAASMASLIGIFSIFGRLGTGFLLDRFPAHWVGALGFMLPIVGCALLLMDGTSAVNQSIAAATIGLTIGSEVDVVAFLAARHFGLKNFGALYGALIMALALGTAFGPLAAGAVHDNTNSYAQFLVLSIVMLAASAVALLRLGPAPATAALPQTA